MQSTWFVECQTYELFQRLVWTIRERVVGRGARVARSSPTASELSRASAFSRIGKSLLALLFTRSRWMSGAEMKWKSETKRETWSLRRSNCPPPIAYVYYFWPVIYSYSKGWIHDDGALLYITKVFFFLYEPNYENGKGFCMDFAKFRSFEIIYFN